MVFTGHPVRGPHRVKGLAASGLKETDMIGDFSYSNGGVRVYYNLGLIFAALAIISIGYCNIFFAQVPTEIREHGNITTPHHSSVI